MENDNEVLKRCIIVNLWHVVVRLQAMLKLPQLVLTTLATLFPVLFGVHFTLPIWLVTLKPAEHVVLNTHSINPY